MIRIATHQLVGLLTDLSHTAADPETGETTASVLLHTVRGYVGDDPGQTDLLVGTSTDGVVLGHANTGCSGQADPMLWPIASVKDVLAVLKPKAKIKEHVVEISRDGEQVVVAEDPDLFGEGMRFTFGALDPADWPAETAAQLLTHIEMTAPAGAGPAAARTDFQASRLAPFLKIASRRGELVQIFRYHQKLPITIQIGDRYRGVASTFIYDNTNRAAGAAPEADVYPLVLA